MTTTYDPPAPWTMTSGRPASAAPAARAAPRARTSAFRRPAALAAACLALAVVCGTGAEAHAASKAAFKAEYNKGLEAYDAGDYETALGHFKAAYAIEDHPLCLFNIGQCHRKLDHVDEAIESYGKFLATGKLPDLRAETEGYVADLKKLRESRRESKEARRLFTAGKYADAATLYEKAYAIYPEPVLLHDAGLAYQKAGNRAKAIEYYERFLKSDTDAMLRAETEKTLVDLRGEPAPAGATGSPAAGGGGGEGGDGGDGDGDDGTSVSAAGDGTIVTDPAAPAPKKGNLALMLGIGGGALAVAVGVTVVLVVILTGGPPHPDTTLGGVHVSF
ncbi:MAG TPA: tetratricopeptide repeat protein [Myxococcota bacterium]|jgi:tetratricopeptide (TPR) repeat protein|nr:tetratricopeptide repeat protein [Myxococcota bacterium]